MANVDALAHAPANEPSIEDCKEQVRRVVQSTTFRNAATLQLLFQFLTDKTIGGAAESLKEYTIGVEALGRKPDFDPKLDPIVRVQSHRLRVKLKEYYDVEGQLDLVLIQFPKGHYVPTFEAMPASLPALNEPEPAVDDATETATEKITVQEAQPTRSVWGFLVAALTAVAMIALGYWFGASRADKRFSVTGAAVAVPNEGIVESFWARFLGNDASPVIAYPDAVFLLDDSNDLFRFRHGAIDSRGALVDPHVAHEFAANPDIVAKAGQLYYENGYTGTGELEAVGMLAGLLGRMGAKPIMKSSRDVTPDDLNQHNVILLGSPFQNPAVAQLMAAGDFSYSNPDQHHEQWRAQILDAHPVDGEKSTYGTERDQTSKVLTTDYSLITIAPGVTPGRWIAIVGGLDTKGTEGAAMFVTSKHGVERLNSVLDGMGSGKELLPFQALVRVQLAKGYQVLGADLISVHRLHPAKAEPEAAIPSH
ncbi:hypothetical protein H7849_16110 [Alloacidobacterium dinghuense]|uniref:Adenylate cyclase n=1 Tax=Alloacidobacterium dinghuense TaxID=2763107 RepID=A0A7G8BDN4_9BACT|nr:hypothetical protein [Alloacidobacterium dinghuense]QNI30654.1 hypothetical protein H7849_16110 [Alloacidobacterium dinghuense]